MKKLLSLLLLFGLVACDSSTVDDALEIIEGVDREEIDRSRMGVNAFGNKRAFGSACQQYREVRNTLGLRYLRILINWNDGVQPAPAATPDFSFYDELINCIPAGADALLVVNGLPSWMRDSSNWGGANVRIAFVEQWFRKVFRRYQSRGNVIAFQVWNEPNYSPNPENNVLDVLSSPENYVEMLAAAYSVARDINSSKRIVNAATTAIAQNYKSTLNYNKAMRDAGIENFVDIFAIHYYGTNFERVVSPDDGIADFLNGLSRPIWITESGKQGATQQLEYVETVWPYLRDKVSGIDRIYYYQFASEEGAESAFGLKNLSGDQPVSDLYSYLQESNS